MAITGRTICADALAELNVLDVGATMGAADADFCLGKLTRLFDNWNAERSASYADQFVSYTLTPALSPHTMGPTGTFVVAQRPVSIEAASLVLSSTNHPEIPITIREAAWYAELTVPTLTGAVPTDLYYEPAWPNGNLFFYPVPTTAYQVSLQTRVLLTALSLTDTFTLPPGYRDAATLTLAEEIAGAYERPVSPTLERKAREARARIFANNRTVPSLETADAGMPGSSGPSGTYYTGWF